MEEEVILQLPQDVHKLCRACLAVVESAENHDTLLYDSSRVLMATQVLEVCYAFEIIPGDGLPKSICDDCATRLEDAYNFRNMYERSEDSLRKLLNLPLEDKPTDTVTMTILGESDEIIVGDSFTNELVIDNASQNNLTSPTEDELSQSVEEKMADIFKKGTNNLEDNNDSGVQLAVLKLIEERKEEEKSISTPDTDTIDYEDIIGLVEERKQKTVVPNSFPDISHVVKQEILSENEETLGSIMCSMCEAMFQNEDDFNKHNCKSETFLEHIFKTEQHGADGSDVEFLEEEHIESLQNGKEPPFSCSLCDMQFFSKESRNIHLSMHNHPLENAGLESFPCDICYKLFMTESKLVAHFYKHAVCLKREFDSGHFSISDAVEGDEAVLLLTCNICMGKFDNLDCLQMHTEKHSKHEKVRCEVCNNDFMGELNLIKHYKTHGMNVAVCRLCLKRFSSFAKLKTHMKQHMLGSRNVKLTCGICKESFNGLHNLKLHALQHLDDVFECQKCKRTFHNKVVYENHMKEHSEPRFLCSLCGKQYFSKITLATHMHSHNKEKPFPCPSCQKRFSSRATLSVHKRIHSSFKPYVCSYCGYSCRQSGDLQMHIRTHTGERPYLCKFPNCERRFTTASQRQEHYRRHTNERNHKCCICTKAFLESKTLKVHMLTHTGEKPHSCSVCGKKFRRAHHLTNHMKGHRSTLPKIEEETISI